MTLFINIVLALGSPAFLPLLDINAAESRRESGLERESHISTAQIESLGRIYTEHTHTHTHAAVYSSRHPTVFKF
uniref:Uncharacterized protein n=1 Tax=Fundulus heteroclitus TaxID=8078 RepID=A0A3Q2Q1S1_FUNHE